MRSVAVVVPLSTQFSLTADEEISLRHIDHFLGKYDKYFVAPQGLSPTRPGYKTVWFPRKYFGSALAHARLQLSEEFYTRFTAYEYILMHHLDALVLSDQLDRWCETGLDFVGPPWLPSEDSPWVKHAQVGNSGFALMKVESFLSVIRSRRRIDPDELWREFCAVNPAYRQWLFFPRKYLKRLHAFNNVRWDMRWWTRRKDGTGNGDYFWSCQAAKYWPQFRVASVAQGLEFAFEVAPQMCFELNNRRLPFGSHAWARYDRGFWEPYLLR